MYIDESGDTITLSQKGKKFLVLTGCIIDESDLKPAEETFRSIKKRYYQNPNIEIKSNFLRYANPDITTDSPLKLHDRQKYDELEREVATVLKQLPVTVISIVIDKEAYWHDYPSQNPYNAAYLFLLERFQKYLAQENALGICIIDPREGRVEKHYHGNELSRIHDNVRWNGSDWLKQCPNIVEKLLFSQSDQTVGIQFADLYCYAIFHVFEYDKQPSEYWRYKDITAPKLRHMNGIVDGFGLKLFPDTNKNSLRFYSEG